MHAALFTPPSSPGQLRILKSDQLLLACRFTIIVIDVRPCTGSYQGRRGRNSFVVHLEMHSLRRAFRLVFFLVFFASAPLFTLSKTLVQLMALTKSPLIGQLRLV